MNDSVNLFDTTVATDISSEMPTGISEIEGRAHAVINGESEPPLVPAPPKLAESTSDTFDWREKNDVVLEAQPATAIYWNTRVQVVIRQEASWYNDEDAVLWFEPANLPRLIARLQTEYDSWKHDYGVA
jgi:hypothetical protein